LTFNFIPDAGYEVAVVEVDGSPVVPTGDAYTITNILSNMTIHVTFKVKEYTITATAGTGGEIAITLPSAGATTVNHGTEVGFTVTEEPNFALQNLAITIGGNAYATPTPVGNAYTIPADDVVGNVVINATFEDITPIPDSFDVELVILPTGTDFGTANLNGGNATTIRVEDGDNVTLNYTVKAADADYEYSVASVTYNGAAQNPIPTSGTQLPITADMIIEITFQRTSGIIDAPLTSFAAFPNPTTGNLLVTGNEEVTKIEVVNSIGIVEMVFENPTDNLDLSNLGNGFYFLRVHSAKGIEYRNVILNK
jgi:hypothetical protein